MPVKVTNAISDKPVEPVSYAAGSMRRHARADQTTIQDDGAFLVQHLSSRGLRGPALLKTGIKSSDKIKTKRLAAERREAEELAELHLRHRIEDNERRHPEIFKVIRSADFLAEYERKAGKPWDRRYESDMDEMRARVLLASR